MKTKVLMLAASVLVLAVPLLGGNVLVSPVQAARPAQTVHTCQNIQLQARAQSSQGAAGTIAIVYRLHNMRGQPCTLMGYPGIQLLDRNFASLPTTVHRGGGMTGSVPAQAVTVRRYGNAYFALFYSDVPTANQPPCARAHYVMIIAPNDNLPVVTYAFTAGGSIMECSGNVYVTPVTGLPKY